MGSSDRKAVVAAVIPARYGSMRFPGKPLAVLCGKTVLQRVYEKAAGSAADVVMVATDDERIASAARGFGARVAMTSPDHPSGTDRIWEAVSGLDCDVVINVQGDEPFIPPEMIDRLISAMVSDPSVEMATVAVRETRANVESNPNLVKVVADNAGYAMYFSRSMLPYLREGGEETEVLRHWGVYAYRKGTLARIVSMPEGRLEKCEKLEQLRAMENGIRIKVLTTDFESIGIDTPEDLARAEKHMTEKGLK